MKYYKTFIFLWVILLGTSISANPAYKEDIESLLQQLDTLVARKDYFVGLKEARIEQLKKNQQGKRTQEERYWMNKNLYDEYFVYNADSALYYIE